jgi:hypothetical protein
MDCTPEYSYQEKNGIGKMHPEVIVPEGYFQSPE